VLGKQSSKQQAHIAKIRGKFKFLGKFVAKSVMDFRVIDIPLSYAFYKWLIAPNSLCEDDIKYIDAGLYNSIESLRDYLRKRRQLLIRSYKLMEADGSTTRDR
jgi:E3 ubiquitin-protein ligase TRIP12